MYRESLCLNEAMSDIFLDLETNETVLAEERRNSGKFKLYTEVDRGKSIYTVFKSLGSHVKFDLKLANECTRYLKQFMNFNQEHVNFFGDVLMGTNLITFTKAMEDQWWDMVDINDDELQREINSLESIDPSWNVAPNAYNQSCIWLIHGFHNSKLINKEVKHRVIVDIITMLSCKFLSSMLHNFFNRGRADKNIAMATYSALSKKYGIKNTGNWGNFLRSYATRITADDSKWYPVYTTHKPDRGVIDMINDIQVGIKSVVVNIRGEMQNVIDNDKAIRTTGLIMESEGDTVVVDVTSNYSSYTDYILTCLFNKETFVKDEILDACTKLIHTVNERYLRDTLISMSDNSSSNGNIGRLCIEIVTWALQYAKSEGIEPSQLGTLLIKVRGLLTSSNFSVETNQIKDDTEKVIEPYIPTKSSIQVAACRSAVILYVIIRALTKQRYS